MSYAILNNRLPQSKYKLKSPHEMVPEYITVHNTANDASAVAEIEFMLSNNSPTSYHVAVDDKHVVQAIPFNRNAYHAGDGDKGTGNRKSIGVEICFSKSGGERYKKAEENAVEYIARLLKSYDWDVSHVKKHQDWSGKHCPHRILSEGRWESFKARIAKRLAEIDTNEVKKVEQYKKDAQPTKSLADEFNKAVKLEITDGTYPQRPATREEVAVMIVRAIDKLK